MRKHRQAFRHRGSAEVEGTAEHAIGRDHRLNVVRPRRAGTAGITPCASQARHNGHPPNLARTPDALRHFARASASHIRYRISVVSLRHVSFDCTAPDVPRDGDSLASSEPMIRNMSRKFRTLPVGEALASHPTRRQSAYCHSVRVFALRRCTRGYRSRTSPILRDVPPAWWQHAWSISDFCEPDREAETATQDAPILRAEQADQPGASQCSPALTQPRQSCHRAEAEAGECPGECDRPLHRPSPHQPPLVTL